MKDNIVFKKIWEDRDFFELEVICSSMWIKAKTNVYTTDEEINNLFCDLIDFTNNKEIEQVYWQAGEKGDDSTTCITFSFTKFDSLGHVRIEVFMEINDGGKLSKHNCCFYVNSEIGFIYNFAGQLQSLVNPNKSVKRIVLNKIS